MSKFFIFQTDCSFGYSFIYFTIVTQVSSPQVSPGLRLLGFPFPHQRISSSALQNSLIPEDDVLMATSGSGFLPLPNSQSLSLSFLLWCVSKLLVDLKVEHRPLYLYFPKPSTYQDWHMQETHRSLDLGLCQVTACITNTFHNFVSQEQIPAPPLSPEAVPALSIHSWKH